MNCLCWAVPSLRGGTPSDHSVCAAAHERPGRMNPANDTESTRFRCFTQRCLPAVTPCSRALECQTVLCVQSARLSIQKCMEFLEFCLGTSDKCGKRGLPKGGGSHAFNPGPAERRGLPRRYEPLPRSPRRRRKSCRRRCVRCRAPSLRFRSRHAAEWR